MNATISIARAGQELGAWSAADIDKMLQTGVLTPADQFWQDGMTEWATLDCFVPSQPATMIFSVRFGHAWSVDKIGFVGKGELHLAADAIELMGCHHWSRLPRLGVFVVAAPLGWYVCGSMTGALPGGTDAARFFLFCADLFTVFGVPLLVLTLIHYFCVSWVMICWPRTSVVNVHCTGRVITFDVPAAKSSKRTKAVIQTVDAATAEAISRDLRRGGTSIAPEELIATAFVEQAVPVSPNPPPSGKPSRHFLARSIACLVDTLIASGGFIAIFAAVALSPSQLPLAERSPLDGFGGNFALCRSVVVIALVAGSTYFLFRDGLPHGSFGKRLFGLTVIHRQSESRCSCLKSVVRNSVFLLLYVEPLALLFSRNGRRLGDHLAGTQVGKKEAHTESAVATPRLDPARGKGIAVPLVTFTSSGSNNAPPATTARVSDRGTEPPKVTEVERLMTLNSLREKGLITTELFEAKRREILQDL